MRYKGLKLDKFQVDALKLLEDGYSVVVCAPTGAGKTLIAEYLIEKELQKNNNVIYTAPIKAINNQKFRDFSKIYGDKVGILTGDVTINPLANCLIMTTEIFRNMVLEKDYRLNNVSYVIFDEVHYMDDKERGSVWEESFIYANKNINFLCLSATIANIQELCDWLSSIRQKEFKYIINFERPVPLKFYSYCNGKFVSLNKEYTKIFSEIKGKYRHKIKRTEELYSLISSLHKTDKLPVIVFVFSRIKTEFLSAKIAFMNFLDKYEKETIKNLYFKLVEKLNMDRQFLIDIERLIFKGICYHHAGLLPSIKELVEQLFTTGLIKVLFATETFALGVNFPARSIIFSELYKKQNGKLLKLRKRDFFQMAGRAGRRGIDKVGYAFMIAQPKINFDALWEFANSKNIEPISSRFNLNYATILNLYRDLGENIIDAFEKSFAYFLYKRQSFLKTPVKIKENLQNKLRLLKHLKYIDRFKLTAKGNFASKLYGYEIFLTETFFDNILDNLPTEELVIVFSALIFDSDTKYVKNYQKSKTHYFAQIEKKSEEILKIEKYFNINNSHKGLNYALSYETSLWFNGADLEKLYESTQVYLGDIIRHFRQVLQLCRELMEVVQGYKSFTEKLYEIIIKLNRSEVDAYKQLKQV